MTENKSKFFLFHKKNLFNKKIICLISSGGRRPQQQFPLTYRFDHLLQEIYGKNHFEKRKFDILLFERFEPKKTKGTYNILAEFCQNREIFYYEP